MASGDEIHAVTGAYGYSGKYIAQRLLADGRRVLTLTGSINRPNPFGDRVQAIPFQFDNPRALTASLEGVSILYNTYWVRFNHRDFRFSDAIRNSMVLFEAAKAAGVRRIVHISISNPSENSPLEYFRGKARLERALIESGLSYSILRPTVLFGKEDILVNNIAWVLRRMPVFPVFGDGLYKLQPIYVDDLARLAVEQGMSQENQVIDAIGPETFTYRQLAKTIGETIGRRRPIVSVSPLLALAVVWAIGKVVGDVVITRQEIAGLMGNLLFTNSVPVGATPLTDWTRENAATLGLRYTSELARRVDRESQYASN